MEKHTNSWVYMVLMKRLNMKYPYAHINEKNTYINVIYAENINIYAFYEVYFNKTFEFYT